MGTALEGEQQRAIAHVSTAQEPLPGTAEPAPGQLVVETDGVFVRYRCQARCCAGGWHEAKLGITGGWVGQRPDALLQAPSYVAAREDVATFAPRLVAEWRRPLVAGRWTWLGGSSRPAPIPAWRGRAGRRWRCCGRW